jgi:hypothetical protein
MKLKNTNRLPDDQRDAAEARKVLADMKHKGEKPIPLVTLKKRLGLVLPDAERKRLQSMIDADGLEATRKRLGISRHAMERAAGGLTIQRGTAALLEQQLQEK